MRLLRAEIVGFGNYRQKEWSFEAGNQLIYGENEAGKSTLYQFIQAMLFGFPKKSAKKRDYMPQDGAAYGGRLWISLDDYPEIKIERFRQIQRGKARVWLGTNEVTEARFYQLLGALTPTVFQDVYTFQQEQLSQIERLQENELHDALLSLGISGSQQLMAVIQEDRKQNQGLFRPRGQRLPLNQKIQAYDLLQARIQEKEAQEAQVQKKHQRIQLLQQQLATTQQRLSELHVQQQVVDKQQLHWTLYEEWQHLMTTKTDQIVDWATQRKLQQFYQRYQQLTEEIQKRQAEIARLEQGKASDRYFFYLDQEAQIQQLSKQQIALARLQDQLDELTHTIQHQMMQQRQLEQKWRWQAKRPPQPAQRQMYDQLTELEERMNQIRPLQERLAWLQERQQTMEQELSTSTETKDTADEGRKFHFSSLQVSILGLGLGLALYFWQPLLGLVVLIASGSWLGVTWHQANRQAKPSQSAMKQVVEQEKQAQLALYLEEQKLIRQQLADKQHTIAQLQQQLQPFFGRQSQLSEWRTILQTYDEQVTAYLGLLQAIPTVQQEWQDKTAELQPIREIIAPFTSWLPLENLAIAAQVQEILAFGEEMQAIKMERLQQPSTLLAKQVQQLQDEKEQLVKNHQTLLLQVDVQQPTDIPMFLKQWQKKWQNQQRLQELTHMLQEVYPEPITQTELLQQVKQVKQENVALQTKKEQDQGETQRLRLELEQLQQDGTLDDWYQQRTQLADEIQELSVNWATNEIHAAILSDLATDRSEQQLPQLLKKAGEYFAILTNQHYQKVAFVEGVLVVYQQTTAYDIYQLSTGTKDQLIMALRFAYLAVQGEKTLCPVIIDDGWLHYDHHRKRQLAKLFAKFGQMNQVICLSSDREMVSYYQELVQPVRELTERM